MGYKLGLRLAPLDKQEKKKRRKRKSHLSSEVSNNISLWDEKKNG